MRNIVIATGNAGKVREFHETFNAVADTDMRTNILLTCLADYFNPVPEIIEDGSTFFENAKIKADWTFEHTGGIWSIADDSGLEVDALNGAPGVFSARYGGSGATAKSNNDKLLYELRDIPEENRTARFKCVLVLKTGIDTYHTVEGTCEGRIIDGTIGDKGFGYDPLFMPNGYNLTFAQLDVAEKNAISHRGKALTMMYAEMARNLKHTSNYPSNLSFN